MFDGVSQDVVGLLIVPADMVRWLPRVQGHLQKMADGSDGKFWREDIEERLCAGIFQMWIVMSGPEIRSVLLTEIGEFPRMRVLRFVGCVGHRWRDWAHLMQMVEAYAHKWECQRIEALTHGWKFRHMLPGFLVDHVLFSKDI